MLLKTDSPLKNVKKLKLRDTCHAQNRTEFKHIEFLFQTGLEHLQEWQVFSVS